MPDPPGTRPKTPDPFLLWVQSVDRSWTPGILLSKEGFFPLEEVAAVLDISTSVVKAEVDKIERRGGSAFSETGVFRQPDRWLVRIDLFRSYYLSHLRKRVRPIGDHWDGDVLLQKEGVFYLSDVCRLLSLNLKSVRTRASRNPNSKAEYGIWKDEKARTYLVDMEIFAPWIRSMMDENKIGNPKPNPIGDGDDDEAT